MREILFKAIRKDNKQWVEGSYIPNYRGKPCIAVLHQHTDRQLIFHEVHPETVGQFTGKTDDDDTKVFTNDLVKLRKGEVVRVSRLCPMHTDILDPKKDDGYAELFWYNNPIWKIVGNANDKEVGNE